MKTSCRLFPVSILASVVVGLLQCLPASAVEKLDLPTTGRVVFIGDSITYAGGYVGFVEAYVLTRNPQSSAEFINVGLPSETASGLSEPGHLAFGFARPDVRERLARVLERVKPNVLFVCYGMNDGIYQPFDDERFSKFKEGIAWIHEQAEKAGAKVIHLTPPIYDELKGGAKGYEAVLDRYSEWLLSQRSAGWKVVDVHSAMAKERAERRVADPDFTFAKDGIHPDELGHWVMAKEILLYLGASDLEGAHDSAGMLASYPQGAALSQAVAQRQGTMRDAWLTFTEYQRPGLPKGLPLEEAREACAAQSKLIQKSAAGD